MESHAILKFIRNACTKFKLPMFVCLFRNICIRRKRSNNRDGLFEVDQPIITGWVLSPRRRDAGRGAAQRSTFSVLAENNERAHTVTYSVGICYASFFLFFLLSWRWASWTTFPTIPFDTVLKTRNFLAAYEGKKVVIARSCEEYIIGSIWKMDSQIDAVDCETNYWYYWREKVLISDWSLSPTRLVRGSHRKAIIFYRASHFKVGLDSIPYPSFILIIV